MTYIIAFLVLIILAAIAYPLYCVYFVRLYPRMKISPHRVCHNDQVTLVTGAFDIGNYTEGIEEKFGQRSFEKYVEWLEETCTLNANMVIFVPPRIIEQVKAFRTDYPTKTKIIPMSEEDLQRGPFYKKICNIIEANIPVRRPQRVEVQNPMYNTIMFSKTEMVAQAISLNPFQSKYFFWIDAGTFSPSAYSYRCLMHQKWPNQEKVANLNGKVALTQIRRFKKSDLADLSFYFADHRPRTSGAVWGGSLDAMKKYCQLFREKAIECLDKNLMDDDQIIQYLVLNENPDLVKVISGKRGFLLNYRYLLWYFA